MDVRIAARVAVTEDPEKVAAAIRHLFPQASIQHQESRLVATTTSLNQFKILLEKQKIRDTARTILQESRHGDRLTFNLHKQAAYAGKVNFATVDHPLGHLEVIIHDDAIPSLINWLTAA